MDFLKLVDISKLQELCQSFSNFMDVAISIVGLEGEVIVSTGWQEICTCYHRVHPATAYRCQESDTLFAKVSQENKIYQCLNGMFVNSVPITIQGKHVANLINSQFFFEFPNKDFFIQQAEQCEFEKKSYLDALAKVPILSKKKQKLMTNFLIYLAHLIGEMGLNKKKLEETNQNLYQQNEENLRILNALKESEIKFRNIAENIPGMVFQLRIHKDGSNYFKYFSLRSKEFFGETICMGSTYQSWSECIHPADRQDFLLSIQQAASGGTNWNYEGRLIMQDGTFKWFRVISSFMQGSEECFFDGVMLDHTDYKVAEKLQLALYRLSESVGSSANMEELYSSVHEIISELIPAKNFYIALYNKQEQMISIPYSVDKDNQTLNNQSIMKKLAEYVIETGNPLLTNQIELIESNSINRKALRNDTAVTYWLGVPLKTTDNNMLGVMAVKNQAVRGGYSEKHQDILTFVSTQVAVIIERKQTEKKLEFLSMRDSLTGLYNRAYFEDEMKHFKCGVDSPVSLIICDVDGLKLINDAMGHAAGDTLLIAAAQVIQSGTRNGDETARIGGDEFAIVLPQADELDAELVCKRIRKKIAEYNQKNTEIFLSLSIGYATSKEQSVITQELFMKADNNMYQDKLQHSESARTGIVRTMMNILKVRGIVNETHIKMIQNLVSVLAMKAGVASVGIDKIHLLAEYRDIGKVSILDQRLFLESIDSKNEKIIRRHCETGYVIAKSSVQLSSIADWFLKCYEWWNGEGYPLGLAGVEIPLECRILAIADAYHKMTNESLYPKKVKQSEVIKELRQLAGVQLDPNLVELFISALNEDII